MKHLAGLILFGLTVLATLWAAATGRPLSGPRLADPNGPAEPPPPGSNGSEPFDPTPPPINAAFVWTYATYGCTDTEIADRFLVDEQLVRTEYANTLRSARALRRFNIRRSQTTVAIGDKASASMLIWLGRNEVGQSNAPTEPGRPEPTVSEDGDGTVEDGRAG